jgi:hypothetical protein
VPQFKLIVFSDPLPGRDDEYNDWYDNTHLADALTLPGFKSAQRFKTGDMDRDAPCRYAAIYEVEAASLDEAVATARSAERFPMTDAIDLSTAYPIPLTPLGPVRYRDAAPAPAQS